MFDTTTLIIIAATFFLAGSVKGVIGLGLPTIILGLLVTILDLTTAMALMLIPSFVTNIWQALVGGHGRVILRRIWPFLLLATSGIWLGSIALIAVNPALLLMLLGLLLFAYACMSLYGISFTISARNETGTGVLLGITNGILAGMTGSFAVPGVLYLQSLGLSRDLLVQAMGMLFSLSTVSLALVLQKHSFLTAELITISTLGVLPAIAGMMVGRHIRRNLSEHIFRQIFLFSLLVLGVFIATRAMLGLH